MIDRFLIGIILRVGCNGVKHVMAGPFLLLFIRTFFLSPVSLIKITYIMKIQLLIISLLFMTNGLCARGLDKAFQLLPQPQSVELLPGK